MKIICHKSTEPTARKLADICGFPLLVVDGHTSNSQENVNIYTEHFVNWGYRMRRLRGQRDGRLESSLNASASMLKMDALNLLQEKGVTTPRFLSGRLVARPPMTRKGKILGEFEGIAMEVINKDLEFRVDVFNGKAFRLHVKTGPPDKFAWNRDGSEWVTFGVKTMARGITERFSSVTESQAREVIELAKNAVAALDYDFGAVDIIRESGTNKMFVLEVNSAPSLDDNGLRKYADRILRHFGITNNTNNEAERSA